MKREKAEYVPFWMLGAQALLAAAIAVLIAPRAFEILKTPDFVVFWAAQHVARPYDAAALSKAVKVGFNYPYPPTFLLLTLPLRWLSRFDGYVVWMAFSAAAFVAAVRRRFGILLLCAPAVFVAAVIGQSSLLAAALLFSGMASLERPGWAGLFLGLAACVKPQAGLLLPAVLVAGAQWRVIAYAALTVLVLTVVTTATYGASIWSEWLLSLPEVVRSTDANLASKYISLPGAWRVAPLGIGLFMAWAAARRGDIQLASFIAVAGATLGSLHSMGYDQAILAPFALCVLIERRLVGAPFLAFLASPLGLWPVLLSGLYAAVLAGIDWARHETFILRKAASSPGSRNPDPPRPEEAPFG